MRKRTIQYAVDTITGERLDADILFKASKPGFAIRTQYNLDEVKPVCLDCGQPLEVSTSKKDFLHFKHFPNSDHCDLKNENVSTEELEARNQFLGARESFRHKELKRKIVDGLQLCNEVEEIQAEKTLVLNGIRKRPEVYCHYRGMKIAFEIQLSDLSPRYLFKRYEFYKNNGIYLIWILDNFDVKSGVSQTERDIKYLYPHQNFFHLDERTGAFRLICEYKECFLSEDYAVHSKWKKCDVKLEELNFSAFTVQAYYYNYEVEKVRLETKVRDYRQHVEEQRLEEERQREEKEEEDRIEQYLTAIRKLNTKDANAFDITDTLKKFDRIDNTAFCQKLNNRLGFKSEHRDFLVKTLLNAHKKWVMVLFILRCSKIEIPLEDLKFENKSLLLHWIEDDTVDTNFFAYLFNKGYRIKPEEMEAILKYKTSENVEERKKSYFVEFLTILRRPIDVENLLEGEEILFDLVSLRDRNVVHKEWKNNGMIQLIHTIFNSPSKKPFYYYHLAALNEFDLMDELLAKDVTGKLKGKIEHVRQNMIDLDMKFHVIISKIFPYLLVK